MTATDRVRSLLADRMIEPGESVADIRDSISPFVPVGDVQVLMRQGLDKVIRDWLRDTGLAVNHLARDEESGAAPVKEWALFTVEEVIQWTKVRLTQQANDRESMLAALSQWCDDHPEADLTPDAIIGLAA